MADIMFNGKKRDIKDNTNITELKAFYADDIYSITTNKM